MNSTLTSILLLFLTASVYFIGRNNARQNRQIGVSRFTFDDPRIPAALDGYRILVLSDLHNAEFGPDNAHLLAQIAAAKPDLVAITGDLINKYHLELDVIRRLLPPLTSISPVVFVSGNHEEWMEQRADLEEILRAGGVTLLDESELRLGGTGSSVLLMGTRDPNFYGRHRGMPAFARRLQTRTRMAREDALIILLSHRCELLDVYAAADVDLVLAGHAHGGQVRLPGLPGLFAPYQGFFPRYTAGVYRQAGTTMIVSRGLANNSFPPRLFNPPELLLVTLRSGARNAGQ